MVHQVLTRTTYIGQHRFNTYDVKEKGRAKPAEEHAIMEVPPIVTVAEFEAVQRSLKARSPKMMAPRAVGGSTLLTGICFCACCGGSIDAAHRHQPERPGVSLLYLCDQGSEGQDGMLRRHAADGPTNAAVVEHLEAAARSGSSRCHDGPYDRPAGRLVTERRLHVADMERRATEADTKLARLYEAIENGLVNMADPSLKARIAELTAIRDQARGDADRAVAHIERINPEITAESLHTFARVAKSKLRHGDGSYAEN